MEKTFYEKHKAIPKEEVLDIMLRTFFFCNSSSYLTYSITKPLTLQYCAVILYYFEVYLSVLYFILFIYIRWFFGSVLIL